MPSCVQMVTPVESFRINRYSSPGVSQIGARPAVSRGTHVGLALPRAYELHVVAGKEVPERYVQTVPPVKGRPELLKNC